MCPNLDISQFDISEQVKVFAKALRFLDSLLQRHEHHLHELNCSGATWAAFGTKSPIFPDKEGTGLHAGTAPVSAPCLSKESEQGGREETTT